jgi:hypothetical protein
MGTASRRQRRTLGQKISVFDAAEVVEIAEQVIQHTTLPGWAELPAAARGAGGVLRPMLDAWRAETPVALRVDEDFARVLATSDTDVELVPDWLDRLPYDIFLGSLSRPLVLHDGSSLNRYHGFLVSGSIYGTDGRRTARAHPRPFAESDGFQFVWLYRDEYNDPCAQLITWYLRGPRADPGVVTLADLIAVKMRGARKMVRGSGGRPVYASTGIDQPHGDELPVLVPLSVQILLYLAARKPDLDTIPPQRLSRPSQLRDAEVLNLGWRVGAAFRSAAKAAGAGSGTHREGGWRMPPHMRKAGWARRRYATRDQHGRIVGDRLGEHGADWYYDYVWIPPTPVNATPDTPVAPVVRTLK